MQNQYFSPLLCVIFSILLSFPLNAQTPEYLKSGGEIPLEFLIPSTIKYKKQEDKLKTQNETNKKDKKQFLLHSNFVIDDLLQSGLVLFNTPVSDYVNEVLQQLPIKDKKLLSKKPRAYVLNTSAVNAFATDQGIILVTLGLLANLENEAQLAFILSHELMHILHQHSLDKFLKGKEISKDSRGNNMNKINFDKSLLSQNMYSRTLEEEADAEGLELFLQSDYDPKKILNTFKVLHYSYLPFDEQPFVRSFFEDDNYVFPDNLWLDKVKPIALMEEEDNDKRSSHPSSKKRMKKMMAKLSNENDTDKKTFIISKERFQEIQQIARYQIPFLELQDGNFAEAVYTAYLVLQSFPNDFETRKTIGKALYMEAKYKNYSKFEFKPTYSTKIIEGKTREGASQSVYHLLSKMPHEEMNAFAMRYNWKLLQEQPEDEELNLIMDDLFIEFATVFDSLDDFSESPLPQQVKTKLRDSTKVSTSSKNERDYELEQYPDTENEISETEQGSKLDKIEASQNKTEGKEIKDEPSIYWTYALVDFLNDEDFQAAFAKGVATKEEREEDERFYESDKGLDYIATREAEIDKYGWQLGIDKVVVIDPFYLSLDERKKSVVQFVRSEKQQDFFSQKIKQIAKIANIDAQLLDISTLKPNEVDKFNDLIDINQYLNQQLLHDKLSLTPSFSQNKINAIADKYDTDFFLWTGVISLREKNNLNWPLLAMSVVVPYIAPFTIIDAATPEYDMLYYAILFDVKTGRRNIIKMDYFRKKDSNAMLSSHIYDVFYQIKSVPK